jgi:hypothetical protein
MNPGRDHEAEKSDYFGSTLEADLVRYLNFPGLSTAEHLAKAKRFTITFLTGEQAESEVLPNVKTTSRSIEGGRCCHGFAVPVDDCRRSIIKRLM